MFTISINSTTHSKTDLLQYTYHSLRGISVAEGSASRSASSALDLPFGSHNQGRESWHWLCTWGVVTLLLYRKHV